MGAWTKLVDWLGNRLDGAVEVPVSREISFDYESCRFMELARSVMVGYLTCALQMCDMAFYDAGGRDPTRGDSYLWNVSPNPNQSRSAFIAGLVERVFSGDGECLVVPVRSGARYSMYIADSWGRQSAPGAEDLFTNISIEGSSDVCPSAMTMGDVLYFDAASMGAGWRELMQSVEQTYDDIADVIFQATADRNGRKWIMRFDHPISGTQDEVEEIKAKLKASLDPFIRSTTSLITLNKGQTLERASLDSGRYSGMNAKDIANIRTDMFAIAANCFRMPSSMLEGNVNNFDQTFTSFLTFCVDPVARAISQEVTRKCFTPAEWARGMRASMDTSHIKHVDLFDVADSVEKLVGSACESPNEVRGFLGQDPIRRGWADEYQMTLNHQLAGEVTEDE